MTLADRIRWILRSRGWSQSELATQAGLTRTHVTTLLRRLEADPYSFIHVETLAQIARATNVRLSWLANGEGEPEERGQSVVAERPNVTAALQYLRNRTRLASDVEYILLSIASMVPSDLDESTWLAIAEDLARNRDARARDQLGSVEVRGPVSARSPMSGRGGPMSTRGPASTRTPKS